ncbi:hypothetical protein [Bacillus thuringiensis]|uniref:hypothetical protein n=1 Tax=Bacillus thuringiensis TaxID=1428 RepID=UPI000BFD28F1|nr:hypothetical protein [Bacillus thuringiensis]PGT90002.1 hypothetical protein COD17_09640 [Bacillus thuringiensis]
MKTREEIDAEIQATKQTIENYRKAVKDGEFPKEGLRSVLVEKEATISALRWVLGENDRYD